MNSVAGQLPVSIPSNPDHSLGMLTQLAFAPFQAACTNGSSPPEGQLSFYPMYVVICLYRGPLRALLLRGRVLSKDAEISIVLR